MYCSTFWGEKMEEKIPYYLTRIDDKNYVHSIDMIYLEGFGQHPDFRDLCSKHHISFDSGPSNRKNKYISIYAYFNFDIVALDICEFIGYGQNQTYYDESNENWVSKKPKIENAPYWVLRFNPNKICTKPYFEDFKKIIVDWSKENPNLLFFKKFDYAIDVDLPIHLLSVSTRKTSGRVGTTLYFGKAGRHGYLKIYDKTKELKEQQHISIEGTHTRLEYTFIAKNDFSFDDISYLDVSTADSTELTDTEKFVLRTYVKERESNLDFDLSKHVGRKTWEKLKNFIASKITIPNGELLTKLVYDYCDMFHCAITGELEYETDIDDLIKGIGG